MKGTSWFPAWGDTNPSDTIAGEVKEECSCILHHQVGRWHYQVPPDSGVWVCGNLLVVQEGAWPMLFILSSVKFFYVNWNQLRY